MKKRSTAVVAADPQPAQPAREETAKKMTIYDYEQKYVRRENVRGAKFLIGMTTAVIGVFLFVLLALLALRVFEINVYAGIAVSAVCLVVYVLVFVVPACRILRTGYFVTNANAFTARKARAHNKKLRHAVADKIIDLSARVEGVGWYDSAVVGRMAVALKTDDEAGVKQSLTELYRGSVKKAAKALIFKSSLKSATYSAISQAAHIDAALVVVVNLQLIKDLVFLYGFRPSDAKLARIFMRVIQNSLVAYGLGSVNVGSTVVKTMGDAVKGIPILGNAISALIDSSVQGLTNGALTTVIGYQTISYLMREYHLQDILDEVELPDTEVEIEEACAELEGELKRKKKRPIAEAV